MVACPSQEQLIAMLADALSPAEHDAVAQHVEGCPACQQTLARTTENSDQEKWLRAEFSAAGSEAEQEFLGRLKRRAAMSLQETATGSSQSTGLLDEAAQALADGGLSEWPVVPGYEILGELGRGGMGVVFKARQLSLPRIVALKMIRTGSRATPRESARFRAEAEAIARLQHPNIVQIHDVGELARRPYLVLEFVAGGSLTQHLSGTPQPPRQAARFIVTVARAVQAAHSSGIVHRDLKPGNILLSPAAPESHEKSSIWNSIPKITDFGLAKRADDDSGGIAKDPTLTGEVLGTPSYMAPEQAATPRQPIGPPADIYALGAIFYELLTGRPPFKAETPLDTLVQVLHAEAVSPTTLTSGVPRDLETICLKCLRKEPRKRYATAAELADDIERFLNDESIRARPVSSTEKVWRWARRRPLAAGLLAAALLAPLVALIIMSTLSARLVRSTALDSTAQQAQVLEETNNEYSRIVRRVERAGFPVNTSFPPKAGAVPLSVPATFLHDVGEDLLRSNATGIQVRQYSDYPWPWRTNGGPKDQFERSALQRLRQSGGKEPIYEFTTMSGQRVVRYAEARIMQQSCVDCHDNDPQSPRKDWKVGDVRGVLEIIRPLERDETRVDNALQLALLLSAAVSLLLIGASGLAVWIGRQRNRVHE